MPWWPLGIVTRKPPNVHETERFIDWIEILDSCHVLNQFKTVGRMERYETSYNYGWVQEGMRPSLPELRGYNI